MKLEGKVAVITGGSKGIGLGCVRVFAKHGATVVIGARGQEAGRKVEKQLADAGHAAIFVPTDIRREGDMQALIDTAVDRFGRLDCMVNNAGWHPPDTTIDHTTVDEFESILRLNLTSTFLGCKFAVPHLRRTRGNIINISSEVALRGQDMATSYVASKAGQLGVMRALARELASDGIRVNAVCPAGVMTPLMQQFADRDPDPEAFLKRCDACHALGRMATIDEIGEVCAFLASEEASFVTGQTICPDGGAMLA